MVVTEPFIFGTLPSQVPLNIQFLGVMRHGELDHRDLSPPPRYPMLIAILVSPQ